MGREKLLWLEKKVDLSGKDWQKKLATGKGGKAGEVQGCGGVPPILLSTPKFSILALLIQVVLCSQDQRWYQGG